MDIVALPPWRPGQFTPTADLEVGPGAIFVAVAVIYTLAFIYLLDAKRLDDDDETVVRGSLRATGIPLFVTFVAIILFSTLALL